MRITSDCRPFPASLAANLRALLVDRFDVSPGTCDQHGHSEAHFAPEPPDAVVYPLTTDEVAAVVRLCVAASVPIVPYGAGTSLEGQVTAVAGGVCVDLSRMDRILAVRPGDLDCTVEAGVTREQLNAHLRDTGLFFPIDPGANATIGGMAATRASGTNAVRYGTMREAVLSLTVVNASGEVVRTSARARKSSAGYDLTRLFVGSEGTLGIITEVTLRLFGVPETISAAVCPFAMLSGAVETVIAAIQCGVPMARIELLDEVQVRAINAHSHLGLAEQPTLFLEFHGSPAGVAEQVDLVRSFAEVNGGGNFCWSTLAEERARLWKARHQAYYAALALRPGGRGFITDVCVPISRLADCILETKGDLEGSAIPAPIVGHVGDGNFHVVFVVDPGNEDELAEVERLNDRMVRRALSMDGTCTGEHGIGLGKQQWLVPEFGDAGVTMMRALKSALDPAGLFNPGKILH